MVHEGRRRSLRGSPFERVLPRAGAIFGVLSAAIVFTAAAPVRAAVTTRPVFEAISIEPSCLDPARFAAAIVRFRGRPDLDARIRIILHGDPLAPAGVELQVVVAEAVAGERHFDSFQGPCSSAERALALASALALDELEASLPPPREAPPVPDGVLPQPPSATKPLELPAPPRRRHFRLGVEGFLSFGTLGAPAFGGAPEISLTSADERLRLRISAWLAETAHFVDVGGYATVAVALGRVDVCLSPASIDRFHLWLCPGVAAGGLYAQGILADTARASTGTFIPIFARAAFEVDVGAGVAVGAAIDGAASLTRVEIAPRSLPLSKGETLPVGGLSLHFGLSKTIF